MRKAMRGSGCWRSARSRRYTVSRVASELLSRRLLSAAYLQIDKLLDEIELVVGARVVIFVLYPIGHRAVRDALAIVRSRVRHSHCPRRQILRRTIAERRRRLIGTRTRAVRPIRCRRIAAGTLLDQTLTLETDPSSGENANIPMSLQCDHIDDGCRELRTLLVASGDQQLGLNRESH